MLKDVTFGQYYPTDSFVHRLDPRLKLIFLIVYIVMLFVANSFYGLALGAILIIVTVFASGVPFRSVLRSVRGLLILLIFTSLLNVFFHGGENLLVKWGVASAVLTLTTTPVSLTDGLESLLYPLNFIKFPVHVFALIMSIALRFIPTLIDETNRIINAQKARGADFESGNIFKRVKAVVPILIPLLISAFRRAEELGDAMDARCYSSAKKRTKYKKLRFGWRDGIAALVAAALIAGIILLNIYAVDICPAIAKYMVVL